MVLKKHTHFIIIAHQYSKSIGLCIVIFIFGTGLSFGQERKTLKVGEKAPNLIITEYINKSDSSPKTLKEFQGRWVILEFWASWCPACINGIDHMNEIAHFFGEKEQEIVFITLSADPKDILEKFFNNRPSETWVAFDEKGETLEAYNIGGFPQAVIIDPNGDIKAFIHPDDLNISMVSQLLDDESPIMNNHYLSFSGIKPETDWDKHTLIDESNNSIYSQVVLHRSEASSSFFRYLPTPGKILGDGVSLSDLIQHAYGVSDFEFRNKLVQSPDRYRVSVVAPTKDHFAAKNLLKKTLEESFNYQISWDVKEMEVFVLRKNNNLTSQNFQVSSGQMGGIAGRTGFHLKAVPMSFIVSSLESFALHKLVIDETGLSKTYNLNVEWDAGSIESVIEALEKIGFDIKKEVRKVQILEVTHM